MLQLTKFVLQCYKTRRAIHSYSEIEHRDTSVFEIKRHAFRRAGSVAESWVRILKRVGRSIETYGVIHAESLGNIL